MAWDPASTSHRKIKKDSWRFTYHSQGSPTSFLSRKPAMRWETSWFFFGCIPYQSFVRNIDCSPAVCCTLSVKLVDCTYCVYFALIFVLGPSIRVRPLCVKTRVIELTNPWAPFFLPDPCSWDGSYGDAEDLAGWIDADELREWDGRNTLNLETSAWASKRDLSFIFSFQQGKARQGKETDEHPDPKTIPPLASWYPSRAVSIPSISSIPAEQQGWRRQDNLQTAYMYISWDISIHGSFHFYYSTLLLVFLFKETERFGASDVALLRLDFTRLIDWFEKRKVYLTYSCHLPSSATTNWLT